MKLRARLYDPNNDTFFVDKFLVTADSPAEFISERIDVACAEMVRVEFDYVCDCGNIVPAGYFDATAEGG